LFELAKINISFIRFFSITQVISDGLLILYFVIVLVISFKLAVSLTKKTTEEKGIIQYLRAFLILLLIVILINEYLKSEKINLFGLGFFMLLIVILLNYIKDFIGVQNISKIIENEWLKELIFPVLLISFFCGSLFSSIFIFEKLHESWFIPDNIVNIKYVKCKLEKNITKYKMLYFNDKYIFVEYQTNDKLKKIEILEFNEFFKKENCK
jgi:hypothetical protein